MRPIPYNLLLACGAGLLPWPLLALLDRASGGCGDGLCGFLPGLMVFALAAGGTLVFGLRSARRREVAAPLAWLPVLPWMVMLSLLAL